jgi:hypothetical protein
MDAELVHGVRLFMSGAAAVFGTVFLVYYVIRLAVGKNRYRRMEPADRARILLMIAAAFGLATILGVGAGLIPVNATWAAIAVAAALRGRKWRKQHGEASAM